MRIWTFGILICLGSFGCGGGQPAVLPGFSEDEKAIGMLVSRVNDDKSSPAVLAKLFATGAAPKDKKELAKFPTYVFDIEGKPSVSGTTATAKVTLKLESNYSENGTQDWTFVKEGAAWKIKTAPLP